MNSNANHAAFLMASCSGTISATSDCSAPQRDLDADPPIQLKQIPIFSRDHLPLLAATGPDHSSKEGFVRGIR